MPDRRPAFTLVELLVVVLVCVVLIALLTQGLTQTRQHASIAAPAGVERDWKKFPAITEIHGAPLIYALGDIHGDYDKAVKTLVAAGLLKAVPAKPEDAKWAGGSAVFVCTGDMIDKGPEGLPVVRLLRLLQADAAATGGRLIVTLGNHEAEFLASAGAGRKTADFSTELRAAKLDPASVAAGTDAEGLGAWLRNLPASAKVDDWFFSHAGNTHGQTIDQLEAAIEDGLGKQGFAAPIFADDDSLLEARMHPVPWWDLPKPTGVTRLRDNATALGCNHLVAGHQPGAVDFADHTQRARDDAFAYEGTLFLIDTGMSRGVDDAKGVVLKVDVGKNESVHVIDSTGADRLLWEKK